MVKIFELAFPREVTFLPSPVLWLVFRFPLTHTQESREMLGIMDNLRYNGLYHSSATQTRRSPRMRVKLQLVMCSDEGHEETVTDVITLDKNNRRIEHLGLTLAEAKQLLSTLQRHLLQQQVDTFLDTCS